jgi:hypothetical protein
VKSQDREEQDSVAALETQSYCKSALWILIIFVLALIPRVAMWGHIVTVDEAYHWFYRSSVFLRAVQNGDYGDTNLIGHPGVTTMWLGSIGLLIQRALVDNQWATYSDLELYRGLVRLPVSVVCALGPALALPLLRRLVDTRIALLGALFWACEPFLIAHGQILHLDALLTTFMTLSLLSGLAACWGARISWPLLLLSGLLGGLALLTKSPSVFLAPMLALIALVGYLLRQPAAALPQRLRSLLALGPLSKEVILPFLIWLAVVGLVWYALWPAAWVDLAGAFNRVVSQVRDDGGAPHAWGNFILGQAVDDPGPLFYPLVFVLRITPWALIGVILALAATLRRSWGQLQIAPLAVLAFFACCFLIAMSIPPKKFDRYLLPIFPSLDLIGAAGWVWATRGWADCAAKQRWSELLKRLPAAAAACVCLPLVWLHPYYMAYYNPLLGGGPVAARIIPVGWGEGFEQVADYLMAQPDGMERPIATWFPPVLSRLMPSEIGPLDWATLPGKVDYAILYIDQVQRNDAPEATQFLQNTLEPVHTVRIQGIDYAQIYRIPPPVGTEVEAHFGDGVSLRGYTLDDELLRSTGTFTLTLHWHATNEQNRDYMMFVHLFNDQGQMVAQIDLPPGGHIPSSTWQAGRYLNLIQPLPSQSDLPAGRYWLALGLYDLETFARLPFRGQEPAPDAPDDGPDALVVGPIEIQ